MNCFMSWQKQKLLTALCDLHNLFPVAEKILMLPKCCVLVDNKKMDVKPVSVTLGPSVKFQVGKQLMFLLKGCVYISCLLVAVV